MCIYRSDRAFESPIKATKCQFQYVSTALIGLPHEISQRPRDSRAIVRFTRKDEGFELAQDAR
jgi:hypothetical protein